MARFSRGYSRRGVGTRGIAHKRGFSLKPAARFRTAGRYHPTTRKGPRRARRWSR